MESVELSTLVDGRIQTQSCSYPVWNTIRINIDEHRILRKIHYALYREVEHGTRRV